VQVNVITFNIHRIKTQYGYKLKIMLNLTHARSNNARTIENAEETRKINELFSTISLLTSDTQKNIPFLIDDIADESARYSHVIKHYPPATKE